MTEKQHEIEVARAGSSGLSTDAEPEKIKDEVAIEQASQNTDGIEYPTGIRVFLVTVALWLSVFLVALDRTIIGTAIPKITDDFNSLDDVGWYGSAYFLTTAAFQLPFGRLYTFFSIKGTFLTAIAIFELGSLICAVAPTSNALIIGRAIGGIGCSGIFSGALIIIAHSIPLPKRPAYAGLLGACFGIASVAGPLLGGVFTTHVSWRWCFYINLPIGAVTIFVISFFFKSPHRAKVASLGYKERIKQFDLIGTGVLIPTIVCLLLALQWGGSKYPWNDGRIIALLTLFGVLSVVFVIIQIWKQDAATVPPRIIKKRDVLAAVWFSGALGSAFLVIVYYIPIWFQAVKGVSAVRSGIMNIPMVLGVSLMAIMAGILTTVIGYYTPFMIGSAIIASIGAGLLSTFTVDTGHSKWIGYQALFGFGIGMGLQQPMIAVQAVLPLKDVPTGTALVVFAQTLGGTLFISIAQNVFTNKLISGLKVLVPGLNPAIVLNTGATSLKGAIDPKYLDKVLVAYNSALVNTFYVAVAMGCLSILGSLSMRWRSVKKKKKADEGAGT